MFDMDTCRITDPCLFPHVLLLYVCSKQKVDIIFVFVFFYVNKVTNIQHTYAHTKHTEEQRCYFQIQHTSLVTTTFEFNLHLTSTHVFLSVTKATRGTVYSFLHSAH